MERSSTLGGTIRGLELSRIEKYERDESNLNGNIIAEHGVLSIRAEIWIWKGATWRGARKLSTIQKCLNICWLQVEDCGSYSDDNNEQEGNTADGEMATAGNLKTKRHNEHTLDVELNGSGEEAETVSGLVMS